MQLLIINICIIILCLVYIKSYYLAKKVSSDIVDQIADLKQLLENKKIQTVEIPLLDRKPGNKGQKTEEHRQAISRAQKERWAKQKERETNGLPKSPKDIIEELIQQEKR